MLAVIPMENINLGNQIVLSLLGNRTLCLHTVNPNCTPIQRKYNTVKEIWQADDTVLVSYIRYKCTLIAVITTTSTQGLNTYKNGREQLFC